MNKSGKKQPVRWELVPEDGVKALDEQDASQAGTDFLNDRLERRLAQGHINWIFQAVLGQPADVTDDPTIRWPEDRRIVKLGTVSIRTADSQTESACQKVNYDPTVLGEKGFALSNDPILNVRSAAYAVSQAKRLGGD